MVSIKTHTRAYVDGTITQLRRIVPETQLRRIVPEGLDSVTLEQINIFSRHAEIMKLHIGRVSWERSGGTC